MAAEYDIFDYIDTSSDKLYICPIPSKYPIHSSIWNDAGLPNMANEELIQSALWKWGVFNEAFITKNQDTSLYIRWSYKNIQYSAKWETFLRWMFIALEIPKT